MRILITGIHGFVGSNLTNWFKDHHSIYGLDIIQSSKEGVNNIFTWYELNRVPSGDAIVHLAGKAHDTKNRSSEQEYFDINLGLTLKIFDYFLESETKAFIFFSSVKAAADTVDGESLTENVIPKPFGPYGESKIRAEEYILSKKEIYESKGKRVYILRPCMIHGPGNKGNLNLLHNFVSKGIPWPLGAYDNKRSFCSIDNISFVVEQLLFRNEIPNGIYHICDDETLSTNEIVRLIGYSVKKKAIIWKVPQGFVNNFARIGDKFHLPLTSDRLKKLTENYVVSNSKIKDALGIDKMPVSARDGMIKTLQSFQ